VPSWPPSDFWKRIRIRRGRNSRMESPAICVVARTTTRSSQRSCAARNTYGER